MQNPLGFYWVFIQVVEFSDKFLKACFLLVIGGEIVSFVFEPDSEEFEVDSFFEGFFDWEHGLVLEVGAGQVFFHL